MSYSEVKSATIGPAGPLRKCIATVALSGTLRDKLEACASVGFDGVEIMEADLLTFEGSPADVRRICDDLGLTIEIYQPFRDFEAMPDPQRARNLDRAERKFDVMQALGTDLVLVCSNTQAATIDDDSRAAADLAEMAERAARRGLRVGYEALSWARHVNRWGHAWRIVQQAGHPALGLIVDSFHTLGLGDDPSGIAQVPAEKLFFVQMADAPKLSMDVLSWSRHFRNFPGQGDLDVTGFMRAVLASGYTGPLSLEVFNDDFRAAPGRFVARDGLRSLILTEADASGGAGLPAVPTLDGMEFLEFAVDETTGAGARGLSADARLPPRGAASVKGGGSVSQRRRQPGVECGAGQCRIRALPPARSFGLRHGDPRGRCRSRADPRPRVAVSGLAGADRRGRAAYSRRARAGRHADLPGAAGNWRAQLLGG